MKTIYLIFLILWEGLRYSVVALFHRSHGADGTYDEDPETMANIEQWRAGK